MAGKDDGSKRSEAAKIGAGASRASAKATAKGGKAPGSGSSKRGRGKPAPVKKPFPVGFAAGVGVLVLLLGSLLTYAATNVGSGFEDALEKADKKFTGLTVDDGVSAEHTNGGNGARVDYPDKDTRPPLGGNHNPTWYRCAVYTAPIVSEHAVHSLEHGAVWITYKPDLPADQVKVLTDLAATNSEYTLLSPYIGQAAPVMATSWGRQISAQTASDPQVKEFVDTYAGGPQRREEAGCASGGQITLPGTTPFVQGADGSYVPGPANGPVVSARGPLGAVTPSPTSLGGTTGTPSPAASAPAATPSASATP